MNADIRLPDDCYLVVGVCFGDTGAGTVVPAYWCDFVHGRKGGTVIYQNDFWLPDDLLELDQDGLKINWVL